jgi:hypothetical protein
VGAVKICPQCGTRLQETRDADLADLITLLALCRDALDKGHGDLARAVLHLIIEHQRELGRRARDLARRLAQQMAEADRERHGDSDPGQTI